MKLLQHSSILTAFLLVIACRSARAAPSSYRVPYRLSDTKHLVVRVKLNGVGPYNYIIDTGAPAMYLSPELAEQTGVKADDNSFGVVDRVEIEGGIRLEKMRCRIEEPFQLRGMNALGLAGRQLDGIIGYELLAKFRIEIDLTQTKMTWTPQPLSYSPPPPLSLAEMSKAPVRMPASLGMIDALSKLAMALVPKRVADEIIPRGFFGMELVDRKTGVRIRAVLEHSPAAQAGIAANDRITQAQFPSTSADEPAKWRRVRSSAEFIGLASAVAPGDAVRIEIVRGKRKHWIAVTTGRQGL